MRQNLSVLTIAARSSIYKAAALLLLMGGVEAALFWRLFQQRAENVFYPLEEIFEKSGIPFAAATAFAALCVLLGTAGVSGGYTLRRLSVKERRIGLLWSGYNTACFLVFWAVQLLVALFLCRWYTSAMDPAYVSGQTVFLAFYRSAFLHSLLPLAEASLWIRNLIFAVALGLAAASSAVRLRRREKCVKETVLMLSVMVFFPSGMGNTEGNAIGAVFAAIIGALSFHSIWKEVSDGE